MTARWGCGSCPRGADETRTEVRTEHRRDTEECSHIIKSAVQKGPSPDADGVRTGCGRKGVDRFAKNIIFADDETLGT